MMRDQSKQRRKLSGFWESIWR